MLDLSALIVPAFIAGVLTFLAPCTFPLIPAYLGFISGSSAADLYNPLKREGARRRIFLNGLFFLVGLTVVFVLFGTLAGFLGQTLVPYRIWLTRVGGTFVILFGLFTLGILRIPFLTQFLSTERRIKPALIFKRGTPLSSTVLGASFAFGWTPCVGPILGSVLLLASTTATAFQGAFLLFVFSLGLAIPFLFVAAAFGTVSSSIRRVAQYLRGVEIIGGIFLIILGALLITGNFSWLIAFGFKIFRFISYDKLLDYL